MKPPPPATSTLIAKKDRALRSRVHRTRAATLPGVEMASLDDAQRREIEARFADRRVFVQIAAYRDADLPHTVRSALARAARPARVRVGICHQYDDRTLAAYAHFAGTHRP